jgi:hypothetical protein
MKTYLVIYKPSQSITPIFMDEDAIMDSFFNSTDTKNYILGLYEFIMWYYGVIGHWYGNVAVTESGYPILLFNNRSWLMIEASDVFDAVKKAEPILHERIKHTKSIE